MNKREMISKLETALNLVKEVKKVMKHSAGITPLEFSDTWDVANTLEETLRTLRSK